MADFKIKSAAGTGNKTLIQGQDQSGSSSAIEISDAGNLAFGNNGKLFHSMQVFTADGTWTKPAGVTAVYVIVTGAGGGGGGRGSGAGDAGGGGGAGGTANKWITSGLGSTEAIQVGDAGTAGTGTSNAGDGQDSTFGSHCTGKAGIGGQHGNAHGVGAVSVVATGGDINLIGQAGDGGSDDIGYAVSGGTGGNSYWGGGGRGCSGNSSYTATAGQHGGGGGGGRFDVGDGAAGGAGLIVVYEYKG